MKIGSYLAVFVSLLCPFAHSENCPRVLSDPAVAALTRQLIKRFDSKYPLAVPVVFKQCLSVLARNQRGELLLEAYPSLTNPSDISPAYFFAFPIKMSGDMKLEMINHPGTNNLWIFDFEEKVKTLARSMELPTLVHQFAIADTESLSRPYLDLDLFNLYSKRMDSDAKFSKYQVSVLPLKDGQAYYVIRSQIPDADVNQKLVGRMTKAFKTF